MGEVDPMLVRMNTYFDKVLPLPPNCQTVHKRAETLHCESRTQKWKRTNPRRSRVNGYRERQREGERERERGREREREGGREREGEGGRGREREEIGRAHV